LLFGVLMTVSFTAIVVSDAFLDAYMPASITGGQPVRGTLVCILVLGVIAIGQLEFSKLAAAKNLKIFTPVTIVASLLFTGTWYWQQVLHLCPQLFLLLLSAFSLLALLLYQYLLYGTSAVLVSCGASYFSIVYLGVLGGFVPAIRVEFGPWSLLMFVFVVKCSDIGAYAIGSLCGKHAFSPRVSPGKTWEGMAGALATGVLVAVVFAAISGIMVWLLAVAFGFCFACIAQIGDLVESMIKRDAERKDSGRKVPGFGGILDIIDSVLVAAPFAYLFFKLLL
jgi:phosphatidate cytidylyltransferase